MKFILVIFKFFMNLIYLIFKIFKVKNNKITFISRQSNNKSIDFIYLENELLNQNNSLKVVFLCKRFDNIKKHFISYGLYTLKTMYHIATSKVCVIDSYCLPISILKHKKKLKVIQLWHALGAIKKFGYQSLDKDFGRSSTIANCLNMHKNYDLIISGSSEMTKYFSKAFNYPKNKFLNCGLPRIDYLVNEKDKIKDRIYKKYNNFKDKIIILYAPTFRKNNLDNTKELIDRFNNDKYILIIKSHDNQKLNFDSDKVYTCNDFSSMELLTISDYLITDYSAIALEGAVINVKTLYYVYDYELYEKENGLNIDLYKEMPLCVYEDINDIYKVINDNLYQINTLKKYKNKYLDNIKGDSSKIITDKIFEYLRSK